MNNNPFSTQPSLPGTDPDQCVDLTGPVTPNAQESDHNSPLAHRGGSRLRPPARARDEKAWSSAPAPPRPAHGERGQGVRAGRSRGAQRQPQGVQAKPHFQTRGAAGEGPQGTPQVPTAQIQETTATPEKEISPRCSALTKFGERCIAFPVRTNTFCVGHDPALREKRLEACSRGGRTTAGRRRQERNAQDFIVASLTLSDRASLQEAIDAVFRLELTGKLPVARGRHLLRVLAIASRNLSAEVNPTS